MSKSRVLVIIDAGHGGIKDGIYTTRPAKMHTFPDGFEVCEGVINRGIARKLWTQLVSHDIDFVLVYDEEDDDPLQVRVMRANKVYAKDKRAFLLSIHSNSGGGHGFEVFTSPGQTRSDKLADVFCQGYQRDFPDRRLRTCPLDGDLDKEANFYILKNTHCPAVLLENLFFDNRAEAEYLTSEEGQQAIADCIVRSILEIEYSDI